MILFDSLSSTRIMPLKKPLIVVNDQEVHTAQNGINGKTFF